MPVTVIPAAHQPKQHPLTKPATSVQDFLANSCPDTYDLENSRTIASSYYIVLRTGQQRLFPSYSGFVRSAIEAWGHHSHLVLRPEDIWFTILVQMNMYMSQNAECIRHIFVSFRGQRELGVEQEGSWEEILQCFRERLQGSIKTPWMSDWISPGFSTSTETDEVTATVLMMGLMSSLFTYSSDITCGIPSITLLGTVEDWQRLLEKVDRLHEFGEQPTEYASRLRPFLLRFVRTFHDSTSQNMREFWDQMVHAKIKHERCCGHPPTQYMVSGWILVFFYWSWDRGVHRALSQGCPYYYRLNKGSLEIDGVKFGPIPLEKLPLGYAKAKYTLEYPDAAGGRLHGWIIAGSMGKIITNEAPQGYEKTLCTMQRSEADIFAMPSQHRKGRLTSFFRRLSCFTGRSATVSSAYAEALRQKAWSMSSSSSVVNAGHSSIQPESGWALIGPRKASQYFDGDCGEETWGPTVDAIENCDSVEHYNV